MKLWKKEYSLNEEIEKFTVGNDYILDQKILYYDCLASISHAKMLNKISILNDDELNLLVKELNDIIDLSKKNNFVIKPSDEDCHTAIENYLTDKLGNLGKKIHTARSRNDQVLTALRLYYIDNMNYIIDLANDFIESLEVFSNKNIGIDFPGYTHMRKAMPSSISLWSSSFIDSMKDNIKLINVTLDLLSQSPLGSGAGFGVPLDIDRQYTAKELGFKKVQENSIYVQNSRTKFESTIIHSLSQIMFDINKLSTDLITFSMTNFSFFDLPNEFCTGSSIMPQKKNPDVLELLRARYSSILSNEFQVKSINSSLISGYNRDVQLTKECVMDSIEITQSSLKISTLIFSQLKVNKDKCNEAMTDELFATKKVYDLVKQGVPFRDAYKKIANDF